MSNLTVSKDGRAYCTYIGEDAYPPYEILMDMIEYGYTLKEDGKAYKPKRPRKKKTQKEK